MLTQNTTEVAVFNVLSYLYELEAGEPYVMKKAHDVYSGIGESALDQGSHKTNQGAVDEASCPKIAELDDEDSEGSNQEASEKCVNLGQRSLQSNYHSRWLCFYAQGAAEAACEGA